MALNSDRSGSPAIWTMDIDGGNLGMVVKASGESFPQLSPEGKWIAFTAMGSEHWTTLWRVASEGGRAIELNNRLWQRPVISPDGKWIAGFYADYQLSTQKFPESIAMMSQWRTIAEGASHTTLGFFIGRHSLEPRRTPIDVRQSWKRRRQHLELPIGRWHTAPDYPFARG